MDTLIVCSELDDPMATLQSMLKPQTSSLPGHIQAVYIHNILKLIATTLNKSEDIDGLIVNQVLLINTTLLDQ